MGRGREQSQWFKLAHELAETGRYKNVEEVELALKAREPEAALPADKVLRGVIDGTCFRVRSEQGWQN